MMKRRQLFLSFLICLVLLAGCAPDAPPEENAATLWVVTELSNSDGMNLQASIIAERMEEAYPGLIVQLEILPTEAQERELRLKQLRTQIMSGNGPDVYLLPTGNELVSDEPLTNTNIPVDPLFSDIELAMRNGIFLDISALYQADDGLNTAALKQEVMDAGCLGDCRYVLPLRFQIPVVYTRPDLCAKYGISQELLESDVLTLARGVLALEEAETAAIGLKLPGAAETLGALFDYESGDVLLKESQIEDYLRLHQARNAVASQSAQELYDTWDYYRMELFFSDGHQECTVENWDAGIGKYIWPKRGEFHHECFNALWAYTGDLYHWSTSGMPLYTGYLSDILETLGVTRLTGDPVTVYPLRDPEGCVQASVAYFGALGSSCHQPELAYAFLRQFLEEEFQWDIYRPRASKEGAYWQWEHEPQFKGQVEDSLPVRTEGCVEYLWENLQYQVKTSYTSWVAITVKNCRTIQNRFVATEEVPELSWQIDRVYFPIGQDSGESLEAAMALLNEADGTPTDADIEKLAREVRQNLWWNLAEG